MSTPTHYRVFDYICDYCGKPFQRRCHREQIEVSPGRFKDISPRNHQVMESYCSRPCKYLGQRKTMLGKNVRPGHEATDHPSLLDIAWIAGIFEGEGTCRANARSTYASITQAGDRWLVDRIRSFFGGQIVICKPRTIRHKEPYHWFCAGPRARGFLLTIYPFLSPRRQLQIRVALLIEDSSKVA